MEHKPQEMNGWAKRIVSIAFTCVMVGGLVYYAWTNQEMFAGILEVAPSAIAAMVSLWTAIILLAGLRTKLFAGLFDVDLSVPRAMGLEVAVSMTGYVIPFKGSQVMKAMYLKKRHGLPYARFITVLLATYPLKFLAVGATGIALILLMYFSSGVFEFRMLSFFLILLTLTTIVLNVPLSIPSSRIRIPEAFRRALEGWEMLKEASELVLQILLLFSASCLVTGGQLFVGYRALSTDVTVWSSLLVGTLYTFTFFTSVTPGSTGFAEGVAASAS